MDFNDKVQQAWNDVVAPIKENPVGGSLGAAAGAAGGFAAGGLPGAAGGAGLGAQAGARLEQYLSDRNDRDHG